MYPSGWKKITSGLKLDEKSSICKNINLSLKCPMINFLIFSLQLPIHYCLQISHVKYFLNLGSLWMRFDHFYQNSFYLPLTAPRSINKHIKRLFCMVLVVIVWGVCWDGYWSCTYGWCLDYNWSFLHCFKIHTVKPKSILIDQIFFFESRN